MLRSVDEAHLMDIFINGLKEKIGAQVKLHEPQILTVYGQKNSNDTIKPIKN